MGNQGYVALFESKRAKRRSAYKVLAASEFVGICLICAYRVSHVPAQGEPGRWAWIGLFMAELWFIFYWFLSQFARWNPVYNHTFKQSLSQRFERALPGVDVFVCTADPKIEPPIMVTNTVLSVMAYNYPPEKLSVYLSDDGCSELTYYALLEASRFAKHWLPFCRKFAVEPRSPEAYFSTIIHPPLHDSIMAQNLPSIKKLYEEMKSKIETATRLDKVPADLRKEHTAFREWDLVSSRRDHPTILKILIDGRDSKSGSVDGEALPTLVYLAREKRPKYHHNFKAGAMNALIRVSSKISNGSIILNVDCDMYSNDSESVRDALCFFMDEERGHEIAYVQHPQSFNNLTKNDLYSACFLVACEVELAAMDANGGPCYIGSGCFHRRAALCGMRYGGEKRFDNLEVANDRQDKQSAHVLEETSKVLASCTHEEKTQWGVEMGLLYGCPTEDIVTGLTIQYRGWKSKYFNPERKAFLGVAPTTLLQALVQHRRWAEGHLLIAFSRWSPLFYGGRIPLKLRFSYSVYNLWSLNSLATLYYVVVPSFCLLQGISLFPEMSSWWMLPFAYVFIAKYAYSLGEFLCCGGTFLGWWNEQRTWVFRRTTSYLFALIDIILGLMGFTESGFVVTAKVTEDDVSQRYEKEVMEFGVPSPMFTLLATLAMINLFSFIWSLKRIIVFIMDWKHGIVVLEPLLALQTVLCGAVVLINLPVYEGLFFRKDQGKMPSSVTCKSVMLALLACSVALY